MVTELKVDLAIVNGKPPLRALADVFLMWEKETIMLRRCAIFEKTGEPPWVSLPRLQLEKNGKKQFVPLIELSRDLRLRVFDAVLAEYRRRADAR